MTRYRPCVPVVLALLALPALGLGLNASQRDTAGFFVVDGDRIYYEVAGAGSAIVFLHDGLIHSGGWEAVFRRFARGHRVIRFDRRGYGRSDTPSKRYSPVGDLLALLDHLGVERATVVGASAGGGLALEFAVQHPERVTSLVLVGAVVPGQGFSSHFLERGRRNLAPRARGDYRGTMENWIGDRYLIAPGNDSARARMRTLLQGLEEKHLTNPRELIVSLTPAVASRLSEVAAPTLVVVGEHDIPDVHAHAGIIEAAAPGARRVVVSGAGHLVFLERPEELGRLLAEFLEGMAGGGSGGDGTGAVFMGRAGPRR